MNTKTKEKGHSEEFFGDYRNYWYNYDFLELMTKRWELQKAKNLLDVGCGMCHWSRLLSDFLQPGTKIIGVDNDIKWSKDNDEIKADFLKKSMEFSLKKADVYSLPFADNTFDVVTCQTLLIHVDPLRALNEMKRVLKPKGILICAEPNNLVCSLLRDSITSSNSIQDIIDNVLYSLVHEKGKIKQGKGDNSIGDLLPQIFQQMGLNEIKAYLSDKINMVIPPYDTHETQATIEWLLSNDINNFMNNEAKSNFACFDGEFDHILRKISDQKEMQRDKLKKAIKDKKYFNGSGFMMYLVSGTK